MLVYGSGGCGTPRPPLFIAHTNKDRTRLVPQLMGHEVWTAFASEDKDVKPGVCKQCISADLTFSFSDSEMRWQGLCNSCGTITLA